MWGSLTIVRVADKLGGLTDLHGLDTLIPSLDYLAYYECG